MKQIKILIIIITVLIIIFGMKLLGVFENKEKLALEQVLEIVEKSEYVNNYSCTYKISEEEEFIKKYLENKEKISSNVMDVYYDYNTKEYIGIDEKNKIAIINKERENEEFIKAAREGFIKATEEMEEYKYIGEEIYNNYNCVVVQFKFKYKSTGEIDKIYDGEKAEIRFWINKDNGVIMKKESKILDLEDTQEMDFKFNCVKEEEVKIPDLSKYEIIEM